MLTITDQSLSEIYCQKSTVRNLLSEIYCQKSTVRNPLSEIYCQKSTVRNLLSEIFPNIACVISHIGLLDHIYRKINEGKRCLQGSHSRSIKGFDTMNHELMFYDIVIHVWKCNDIAVHWKITWLRPMFMLMALCMTSIRKSIEWIGSVASNCHSRLAIWPSIAVRITLVHERLLMQSPVQWEDCFLSVYSLFLYYCYLAVL